MALEFRPPTDLVNAYLQRPSPGQEAQSGIQQAFQTYVQQKALEQQKDLTQEQRDIELAKGVSAGGQDFQSALDKIKAGRQAPQTMPTGQGPSLIDRAKAFFGAAPVGKNPSLDQGTPTPPIVSTGTVSGQPSTVSPTTDPLVQEYQKDPLAFKTQHGTQGMDKLKTQVEIDKALQAKPDDKYYTTDQAKSLLKDRPDAIKTIGNFEKDKVPRDAVHLMMQQERSDASKGGQTYVGNAEDGSPVNQDKHGNFFVNGQPYRGKILSKTSETPTSTTRSSAEFANTVIPHINEMRKLVKEADQKGYIGPVAGRVYNQFMAGSVGSTGNPDADKLLGRLRATDSLLKTGAMKAHFGARGGQQMYDHFSELLNSGKQSAAMLNGSLDTLESFMQGYADAGVHGGEHSVSSEEDGYIYTPGPGGKGNKANWKKK